MSDLPWDEKKIILVQSVIRKWRHRVAFNKLVLYYLHNGESKPYKHRNEVWRELLQTERHYLRSILFVCQAYKIPLETAAKNGPVIISEKSIKKIFSNIENIKEVNKEILKRLEQGAREWPYWNGVGKIFVELAPYLKLYLVYILNFDVALHTLIEKQKMHKQFREFLEKTSKDPLSCGLNLQGHLIMPIQRIPRYELLLKELLKFTIPEHVDYEPLKKGLQLVHDVCEQINEKKKRCRDYSTRY